MRLVELRPLPLMIPRTDEGKVLNSLPCSRSLTKMMILSGTLAKTINKYREANLILTGCPQIKVHHYSKSHSKSLLKLRGFP